MNATFITSANYTEFFPSRNLTTYKTALAKFSIIVFSKLRERRTEGILILLAVFYPPSLELQFLNQRQVSTVNTSEIHVRFAKFEHKWNESNAKGRGVV